MSMYPGTTLFVDLHSSLSAHCCPNGHDYSQSAVNGRHVEIPIHKYQSCVLDACLSVYKPSKVVDVVNRFVRHVRRYHAPCVLARPSGVHR